MKDKRQSVRMEELFAVMLGMEVVNNHLCSTCVTCYSVEQRYEMAALMAKKPVWMSTEILMLTMMMMMMKATVKMFALVPS